MSFGSSEQFQKQLES
jgi:hypothetical protein